MTQERTEALEWLWNILSTPEQPYFTYTRIEGKGFEYLLRTPLPDGELADESPEVIHICRPIELKKAVEGGARERTVAHSGYVKDGACTRCSSSRLPSLREYYSALERGEDFDEEETA